MKTLVMLVALSSNAFAAPDWKSVSPAGAGCTLALPGTPKVEESDQNTPAGKVHLVTYTVDLGDTYYALARSAYPAALAKSWLPSKVLEGSQAGSIANINATLVKDGVLMIADPANPKRMVPGREFVATVPKGGTLRSQLFLYGNHLYQLMQITGGSIPEKDAVANFRRLADGFRLTQ